MKNITIKLFCSLLFIGFSFSCTNLDEKLYDKVSRGDYGEDEKEMASLVGGVYASLRGFDDSKYGGVICYPPSRYLFFLAECTSDEACIPTRANDWYDDGRYQRAQYHTWAPSDIMILSAWRYAYQGISSANSILMKLQKTKIAVAQKKAYDAELRGLRAYYYSLLLDQFGGVPIVKSLVSDKLPEAATRVEVYNYIIKELNDILLNLPDKVLYSKFTRPVAYALLARLYLNAEVYTGVAHWDECIKSCDKVKGYALEDDFFANFLTQNEHGKELIFAIPYDHRKGTQGNYLASMSYHYKQNLVFSADGSYPGGSNGICAQPGVYSSFEANDVRRKALLVGEQKDMRTNKVVIMDNGKPLDYTEEIHSFTNAYENEGHRLFKYEVRSDDDGERDNDWVLIRYAEVKLMRAEANFRLGHPELALPEVNLLRRRAGLQDLPHLTLELLDKEWLHEFLFEGLRRTVNIRFKTFFKPWWNKATTPVYRMVFPVPEGVLKLNSNLKQKEGYK